MKRRWFWQSKDGSETVKANIEFKVRIPVIFLWLAFWLGWGCPSVSFSPLNTWGTSVIVCGAISLAFFVRDCVRDWHKTAEELDAEDRI